MNRREFTTATLAAGLASATALGKDKAATPALIGVQRPTRWAPYSGVMAIDACAAFGRTPARADDSFDDLELGDALDSGLCGALLTLAPNGYSRFDQAAFDRTLERITYWDNKVETHPNVFARITSGADLVRAHRERKVGLIYGFQDTAPLGDAMPSDSLERVETFYKRGVRVIQLTHNMRNLVGDGCMEPGNAGLSLLGRAIVEKLNAQRILVDVAHGCPRTTSEGIAASKAPVIISHTGCAALNDVPRCVSDDILRAMANRGGVAGIVFWPYLTRNATPTAADVIRHIEHAINVCGEDHVGIGTDATVSPVNRTPQFEQENRELMQRMIKDGVFESGRSEELYLFVTDLNHARRFETLGAMLCARGHSDARIGKILGGNFVRVMSEVWG